MPGIAWVAALPALTDIPFTVASWRILLLAAGKALPGGAFLVQPNLLPALGNNVWNRPSLLNGTASSAWRCMYCPVIPRSRPSTPSPRREGNANARH
jgi:hypothetical protein